MKSKVILITGASRGFGFLAVQALLKNGHAVIAAMRGGEPRFRETFADELTRYPGKLIGLDLHMEKPESFDSAKRLIDEKFQGRLDVLINNAGYGLMGPLEDLTEEMIRHQMDVNFFGPLLLTKKLLPSLRASKGRVINVSSVVGLLGIPLMGAYNASKFALEGYTESLSYELAVHGVDFCLLEPGTFATGFGSSSVWPTENKDSLYHPMVALFHKTVDVKTFGANPRSVVRKLVCLVEARCVPLRTLAGADALLFRITRRFMPNNFRTAFLRFFYRLFFKRAYP